MMKNKFILVPYDVYKKERSQLMELKDIQNQQNEQGILDVIQESQDTDINHSIPKKTLKVQKLTFLSHQKTFL